MYSLISQANAEGKLPAELIKESKDICIVVTDLENSTAQAEKDPKGFLRIQEIHDTVLISKLIHLQHVPLLHLSEIGPV